MPSKDHRGFYVATTRKGKRLKQEEHLRGFHDIYSQQECVHVAAKTHTQEGLEQLCSSQHRPEATQTPIRSRTGKQPAWSVRVAGRFAFSLCSFCRVTCSRR